MKLNQRILILVAVKAVFLFLAAVLIFQGLIVQTFNALEEEHVVDRANLLKYAIEERVAFMDDMVVDWAMWDDSYNYVKGDRPDYVETNIVPNTFTNLRLNGILIANSSQIIHESFYDFENKKELIVPDAAKEEISSYLWKLDKQDSWKGLLMIGGDVVIYAAHRICLSTGLNGSSAYMVFSRYLDKEDIVTLSTHIRSSIRVESSRKRIHELYPDAKEIEEGTYLGKKSEGSIEGLVQLYDTDSLPVAIVHMHLDRTIYSVSKTALSYFITAFLIVILASSSLFFIVTKKYVINKIKTIDNLISEIIATNDLTKKIEIKADEEISNLSRHFNHMINLLHKHRTYVIEKAKELQIAYGDLKKLDELKDDFLSNVSHEIRTPLTALKSYAQLLIEQDLGKTTKEQEEALKIIVDATEQLNGFVSDLLDMSKFEAEKMKMEFEKTNLNELVKEVVSEFVASLKKIKGRIVLRFDNSISTELDRIRIKQVMRNLINNSIKYRGEKNLLVKIGIRKKGRLATISITDNGVGIENENLKKLFSKFYRVDQSLRRAAGGTGLGLAIVKEIVKAHHGRVEVSSKFGKGATFTIYLPL
ncbi:hypothetical protein JXA85_07030 [Candidatus Woesearchaeota archaeon]|nr:hypothetical protein [Candidatus Woesearchaeota archaeon]